MKKILIIVLGLAIIGGTLFVVLNKSNDDAVNTSSQESVSDATLQAENQTEQSAQSQSAGEYVDYSESAFASAQNERILFFHASWCPKCRALEADIKEKGVPEGVTIFKVDYDSNQALRQKYGVTLQTTLVKVDEQGNEIAKHVAYDNPELTNALANL